MGKQDVSAIQGSTRRSKLSTYRGLAVAKTAVVVIVDGKTEIEYFVKLEQLSIFPNLRFKPVIGDDSSYEDIFKENYDIAHKYLILDIDHSHIHNQKRADRIRSILNKNETKEIVHFNNYSFETFLLNHIVSFGSPITEKKQYDKHMKKHFGVNSWSSNKDSHNTSIVIAQITDESFKEMMRNIVTIYKEQCFENPNSSMHLLFEKLEKIK